MSGVGVTLTEFISIESVGNATRMLECAKTVRDSFPNAFAAMITNPYRMHPSTPEAGPYECHAVNRNSPSSQPVLVENPQYMLCFLKGQNFRL